MAGKKKMGCLGWLFLLFIIGSCVNMFDDDEPAQEATKPAAVTEAQSTASQVPAKTANVQQVTVQAPARIEATVVDVTDGDTIKVKINGKDETVRLILVDTPETKHPDKPVQAFGSEASQFTKKLLMGKTVELEKDVTERDKYGRLLFYVYLDGKSVQEMLLEKGLARVAVFPPDVKYVDQYRSIQDKARTAGTGIWSIENYVQEDGYHQEVVAKKEEPKPQPKPAPQPKPEPEPSQTNVYYKNCSEVRAAGADPIYTGEPGYSRKLDRDGDGVACE